jgi:predicted DNA-binding transcriptional regulator AlpA
MERSFQEIILEKELMGLLGVKKGTMYRLRKQGLPCVPLTRNHRVYLVRNVLEWMENRTEQESEKVS